MKTKVIIIGSGIIGLATAYFLNKKGYDVSVIERKNSSGQGASYANGSQISFSHILPLLFEERRGVLGKIFPKEVFGMKVNRKNKLAAEFLSKQRLEHLNYEKNLESIAKISQISEFALREIYLDENLPDDEFINTHFPNERRENYVIQNFIRDCGILHIFESKERLNKSFKKRQSLLPNLRILSKKQILEVEPNLESFTNPIVGGLFFENDKTSNSHKLCTTLEKILKYQGVNFIVNTNIVSLKAKSGLITSVISDDSRLFEADMFVCATGLETNNLLSSLGIKFDIYPVRGYSYTFNCEKSNYIPEVGLIDDANKLVYSFYQRQYLRVAGFFDLGIEGEVEIEKRKREMKEIIYKSFPLLKRNIIIHEWTENRPTTPSYVPIIGKTEQFENLYINAGHGSLGFTLSFGSGKIISELL